MANRKYRQGIYNPHNPEKYRGDLNKITYRSQWERIVMLWLDCSKSVISWSSEENIVPYISPIDGKPHRYFVDFSATFVDKNNNYKSYLIEIKPYNQTIPPKQNKNKRILLEQVSTYEVNMAKWEAAKKYAAKINHEFIVVTEYEIGLKSRAV